MSLPALLTVEQLSEYLRKRPAAVRALAHRGAIAYVRVGRTMRFREDAVERFLDENTREANGNGTRSGTAGRRRAVAY